MAKLIEITGKALSGEWGSDDTNGIGIPVLRTTNFTNEGVFGFVGMKRMAKLIEITGKALSGEWGSDDTNGIGIPVLRTTNFTNEGVVNYQNVVTRIITKPNISEKYLRSGDIIIEKSGGSDKQPVGRVIYYDGPENTYLFNNFTGLLRVKDLSKWFPKYTFYALFANYWRGGTRHFENKTTGLHNLKIDDYVSRFEISEVPLDQQMHICDMLDKVHFLIDSRKQQLTELDNLIKARFVEMFGDPVLDNLIKARFVEMFGDPVQNPFQWDTRLLLDMGYCKNGMNFHTGDSGIEMHCLGVGAFKDYATIDGTDHLPTISLNEVPPEESMLQDGDIVFVRSNGNKALVGRCVVVYPRNTPTTYSGFCIRYRLTSNEVNTSYLLRALKTDSMRKKMAGRGANIQNLNQQILATLNIPLPPMVLQEQFATFVEQVDKSKVVVHLLWFCRSNSLPSSNKSTNQKLSCRRLWMKRRFCLIV